MNKQLTVNNRYVLTFIIVTLAALSLKIFPFQIDDAYITFRFVENFLVDGQFAFNLGGDSAEGFSSPFWFLMLSLCSYLFGIEYIEFYPMVFGSLCFIAIAVWAYIKNETVLLYSLCFLVLSPGFIFYHASGLESSFFSLLVMMTTYSLIAGKKTPLIACVFISVLLRPEAGWYGVLALIYFFSDMTKLKYIAAYFVAPLFFSFGVLILVRYTLFTDVFPNTYYAKSASYYQGFVYLLENFRSAHFTPYVILGVLAFIFGDRKAKVAYFLALSWLVAVIVEGGDWMKLGRFTLPAISSLCLTVAFMLNNKRQLLIPVCVVLFSISYNILDRQNTELAHTTNTLSVEYEVLEEILVQNNIQNIALVDIGKISFRSHFQTFDLAGLTDKKIAALSGGHLVKKIPLSLIDERKVEVVILRLSENILREKGIVKPTSFSSLTEAWLYGDVMGLSLDVDEALFELDFVLMPSKARDDYPGLMILSRRALIKEPLSESLPNANNDLGFPVLLVKERTEK